jgi:hypothetical protein
MKNFRRLCFAVVLAAVFAVPALAGDIDTPAAPAPRATQAPPAPSAAGVTQGPGVAALGDILTPGFAAILLALLNRR